VNPSHSPRLACCVSQKYKSRTLFRTLWVNPFADPFSSVCSADGSTHTESNNLYRKVKIEPTQIFLHANGQSAPRSGGARDVGRGAGNHTPSTASESLLPHSSRLACVVFPQAGDFFLGFEDAEGSLDQLSLTRLHALLAPAGLVST